MRRILTALIVLGTLAGIGYLVWSSVATSAQGNETPTTESPVVATVVDRVVVTGTIVPREEVAIKPRVAGVVSELLVEPGQRVEKGQTLARIEVVANEATVADFQSRVRAARIALSDAELEEADLHSLGATGVVSPAEVRKAKLKTRLAREDLRAAQDGLKAIREGALRNNDKAANLVIATISGTVLATEVKVGASVVDSNSFNEGTTVATIADMTDLLFVGWVDESDVGRIHPQMEASLAVGAFEDVEIQGIVERIAPKGEDREGVMQFEVRASVVAPEDRQLRAGYSANATIEIERRQDVLCVPEKLLQFDAEDPFVEVLVSENPARFERRDLALGLSDGINAEILHGLSANEQVRLPELAAGS